MQTLLNMLWGIVLCLITSSSQLFSQEQLGLRLDNYAGSSGIVLNPAANATNPLAWDITLVGIGSFFNNNIVYIENASTGKILKNPYKIGPSPSLGVPTNAGDILKYNVAERDKYSGTYSARIMGPSISVNLKNGQSFGIFSNIRFLASSHDLPQQLASSVIASRQFDKTMSIDKFKGSAMLWSEYGANYAYSMGNEVDGKIAFGASFKFVQGLQGFFIRNMQGTKITQTATDTVTVDALRATMGFTNNYDEFSLSPNGRGFGLDVGFLMTKPADDDRPYLFRFGASLLDMGKITMSQNVEVHSYNTQEGFQITKDDFSDIKITDPTPPHEAVISRINDKALGSGKNSLIANAFEIGMPAALNLQGDFAIRKDIFVNTLIIQRLPVGEKVMERENLIAVTPRYESRWLGASMPVLLLNGQQMRVGLNARLGFLTIGTDNLGSYFKHKRLYGSDFYMALKVNPFDLGLSEGNYGKNRKKNVSCYSF